METPTANTTAHHFSRVAVLDVLRALALLGMIVVHFNNYSVGGGASGAAIQKAIDLLIGGKAATTFAILFGAGFAIFLSSLLAARMCRGGLSWPHPARLPPHGGSEPRSRRCA